MKLFANLIFIGLLVFPFDYGSKKPAPKNSYSPIPYLKQKHNFKSNVQAKMQNNVRPASWDIGSWHKIPKEAWSHSSFSSPDTDLMIAKDWKTVQHPDGMVCVYMIKKNGKVAPLPVTDSNMEFRYEFDKNTGKLSILAAGIPGTHWDDASRNVWLSKVLTKRKFRIAEAPKLNASQAKRVLQRRN